MSSGQLAVVRSSAEDRSPVIVLTPPDPWVAHVLALDQEGSVILQAPSDARAEELLASEPDVVVADLSSPVLSELLDHPHAPPVIGLVDTVQPRPAEPARLDGSVSRPIVPAELQLAVRRVLRGDVADSPDRTARTRPWWALLSPGRAASRAASGDRPRASLQRTNRVLADLYATARLVPHSLDDHDAVTAAVRTLRAEPSIVAAVVLRHEVGVLTERASFGFRDGTSTFLTPGDPRARRLLATDAGWVSVEDLPDGLRERIDGPEGFVTARLRAGDAVHGAIVAAVRPRHIQRTTDLVADVASELAVAIDNARLFSRLQELSVDEERERLAAELHNGVAQHLAHLRFELEHLSRRGTDVAQMRDDAEELCEVVGDALTDVRAMIYGLNGASSAGYFHATVGSYLREIASLGCADVAFRPRGIVYLSPQVEEELFRFVRRIVERLLAAGSRRLTVDMDGDGCAHSIVVRADALDEPDFGDLDTHAQALGADINFEMNENGVVISLDLDGDPGQVLVTKPGAA
jgi:signal transduction histidine kinase